ncbi:MAG: hypothetical protein M3R24_20665 [Chloroflexota bacterium]|nr:hypothetical protein [Chloroflexota bacterium]
MITRTPQLPHLQPVVGMTVAFKETGIEPLAGIPARVICVWPRLPSGDYLVTLEYAPPVRSGSTLVSQIGAFMSELYQPNQDQAVRSKHRHWLQRLWIT